jgi:hypothetical protein
MKQANISGDLLPWRDILHDGPVSVGLSLEELSDVRAKFIAERGWGDLEGIRESFAARDMQLMSCNKYDKITLWFEHDLYDQLQILQILDWFCNNSVWNRVELSIICTEKYLGMLSVDEMSGMFENEEVITEKHLSLASKGWAAFCSDTPELLSGLLNTDTSLLPFFEGAITRLFQEYPSTFNGLSRTAQQALTIIDAGEKRAGRLFGLNQKQEKRVFMGDSSFWGILNELLQSNLPILTLNKEKEIKVPVDPHQELTLTPAGRELLWVRETGWTLESWGDG